MKLSQSLLAAGVAAVLCMTGATAVAQDGGGQGGRRGGNFDPAEFQQRRLENLRENMGVTDEAEWKVIQERAQKVFEAQTAVMSYRGRGGFGRGGGGGGGGGGRGGFGQPSPELESLRNAVQNNAPSEQIKAALEKYRSARKAREEALSKAQAELKQILTVKQEAVAVTSGLLE